MKTIKQLINFLLSLIGIKKRLLSAYIQNNYIVYVKDKNMYYNIEPLKSLQEVWYKCEDNTYEQCTIINLLKDNKYYIEIERYGTVTRFVTNADKLFAYVPETKVKGYIKRQMFIIVNENQVKKPIVKRDIKLNQQLLTMLF